MAERVWFATVAASHRDSRGVLVREPAFEPNSDCRANDQRLTSTPGDDPDPVPERERVLAHREVRTDVHRISTRTSRIPQRAAAEGLVASSPLLAVWNDGAQPCEMRGWPSLQFLGSSGRLLPTHEVQTT